MSRAERAAGAIGVLASGLRAELCLGDHLRRSGAARSGCEWRPSSNSAATLSAGKTPAIVRSTRRRALRVSFRRAMGRSVIRPN
jgi:hypothetical protein